MHAPLLENCPRAFKGQYHNPKDGHLATISCEAVGDSQFYCWHWFPGCCGTNIDITVVDNSPLFIDILTDNRSITLPEGFEVNGVTRNWPLYYFADGIYPEWSIFVKPLPAPVNDRERYFTKRQMSVGKDVERLFGVLQGRFKILRHESFEWSDSILILISQVCVILHNKIVDMHRRGECMDEVDEHGNTVNIVTEFDLLADEISSGANASSIDTAPSPAGLTVLLDKNDLVRNSVLHRGLWEQLSCHLWSNRGEQ